MERARMPLVVVVLTLDEEVNIAKAIRSVGQRAPVLVVDSRSTDRTREIAAELGAEVIVNPFRDYASQRNFALERIEALYDWVFFLDADEEITEEAWADIDRTIREDRVDGVYFGRTLQMFGATLRHGGVGKHAALRLMRPHMARYEREINERVDDRHMRIGHATGKLVHDDRRPLRDWLHKHVRYAQREATAFRSGRDDTLEGFTLRTQRGRTIGLRWAYNKLPLGVRPVAWFLRTLVVQGGWRDGMPGVAYATMQSLWYPLMIDMLALERPREATAAAATPLVPARTSGPGSKAA